MLRICQQSRDRSTDDDATLAIGVGGGRMHAAGKHRSEGERAVRVDDELVAPGVVVADEVLATAHVTEEHQDV